MIELIRINDIHYEPIKLNEVKLNKATTMVRKYGQHKLILVNRKDTGPITLVSGRYVLQACKALGKDLAYCYVFDSATDEDIATLKLIQKIPQQVDVVGIAKLLEEVKDLRPLASLLPFTVDELRNFRELKDFNWDDYDNNEQNFQTALF